MLKINQLLWFGPIECTEQENRILKRAQKNRKLYVFLRQQRHEIFSEPFLGIPVISTTHSGTNRPVIPV